MVEKIDVKTKQAENDVQHSVKNLHSENQEQNRTELIFDTNTDKSVFDIVQTNVNHKKRKRKDSIQTLNFDSPGVEPTRICSVIKKLKIPKKVPSVNTTDQNKKNDLNDFKNINTITNKNTNISNKKNINDISLKNVKNISTKSIKNIPKTHKSNSTKGITLTNIKKRKLGSDQLNKNKKRKKDNGNKIEIDTSLSEIVADNCVITPMNHHTESRKKFILKSVLKNKSDKKMDDPVQTETRVKFSKNIATIKKFAKDGKKNMRPYPKKTKPPRKLTEDQIKDRILHGISRRATPRKRFERVENHSKPNCNIPSVLSERRGTNRLTSKKRRQNSIEQLLRGNYPQRSKENMDPLLKKMLNLQRPKPGKMKVNSPQIKKHRNLYSSPIASSPKTSTSRFNTSKRGLAILNSLQLVKKTR